jgi:hypothetical protein
VVNRRAGFSLGAPAGWSARAVRGATLFRAPGGALALSVSADRSDAGRTQRPRAYVREAVTHLRGFRRLRTGRVVALRGTRYPAAALAASGTFRRTRVREAIFAVAAQRPRWVTYTLIFFRSAGIPGAPYGPTVTAIVRSLRGQPPES